MPLSASFIDITQKYSNLFTDQTLKYLHTDRGEKHLGFIFETDRQTVGCLKLIFKICLILLF